MISENLTTWLNHPVEDYSPGNEIDPNVFYRFRLDWDSETTMADLLASFTADPASSEVTGLVIGAWFGDDSQNSSLELVQLLVGARHSLPNLTAIFFGDIISEENEISWIIQSDMAPLFSAFPKLEHFSVRGGNDLSLGGKLRHEGLRSLTVETGGMSRQVVDEVLSLDLPNLEKLELWLGTGEYGWSGQIGQFADLFAGKLFPKLTHLGLRNAEIANEVAAALGNAPVMDRIRHLDLSLGVLSDLGAQALVASSRLAGLQSLDLHYHYLSDGGIKAVLSRFPFADVSDRQHAEDYGPYVSVGE